MTDKEFALKLSKSRSLVRQVLAIENDISLPIVRARYLQFHARFPHFFRFKDQAEADSILEQAFREVTGCEPE
jgi:hypothetical protein